MINPNKSLAQKALAGAQILRMHAEGMAADDDFFIALMSEPYTIAASTIEQIVEENEKLRAQLVAFQKAANPVFAVDPASGPDTTACYTTSSIGARVRVKAHPHLRGIVGISKANERGVMFCFVHFEPPYEDSRWVKEKRLELIPDE
ncbi:hypothetical protein R537_07150 [Salmonella enterica subsp. enterica serovar Rough O:d:1,7]|uniref:Uncharacterized protein n=1 Tax=Salmonella enterica subsp. enterica serovar Rough O:d:1,7 TaxID=1974323 RepID=A0A974KID1_SALET|nr:hypothetical protein [Salmonella enterica]OSD72725.1 hypothetical protein R537_07150 [Salmonella enterica subsp. enterica serovar Rough O:d:1,7]